MATRDELFNAIEENTKLAFPWEFGSLSDPSRIYIESVYPDAVWVCVHCGSIHDSNVLKCLYCGSTEGKLIRAEG